MLSKCALVSTASTSRLVCARRSFASLVPDSSDHDAHTPPSSSGPSSVSPLDMPVPIVKRRLNNILKSVERKRHLIPRQQRLLSALGLMTPDISSAFSEKLDSNHLESLRTFFQRYIQRQGKGPASILPIENRMLPKLKSGLMDTLRNTEVAVEGTEGVEGASKGKESSPAQRPAEKPKPRVILAERRGRIKPSASHNRIQWDASDSISPRAASQLRERSRHDIMALQSDVLTDIEPPNEMRPIARLAHGLDRALFNPGVNWLQDPRSRVFNYDPWLQKIPSVRDFAFERLPGFVKSSRDEDIWNLCRREDRRFAGSTSSLSGLLCHIYFLLSRDRHVDLSTLSRQMEVFPETFTPGQRMPATVILRHRDGVYATDSDSFLPGSAETNVLSWMGTMLEKFLTTDASTFSRYMRDSPDPAKPDTDTRREAYRYSMSSKMVMRSQLDAVDPRLPGSGVFDIKTRAAMSVRYDSKNWVENAGYLIRSLHGVTESFEREYCDLIRSAFLKYSFQARIGAMDGVMVAYHNTARIFGFQYIPLEEMDARLYGAPERGERVFAKCVQVLELLLETATGAFPGKSVRILAEKHELEGLLRLFVQPVTDEEADAQITANELSEKEEAAQLNEGVDPAEIVSRRVKKAKEAAEVEEKAQGQPIKMFTVQISHLVDGKYASADAAIAGVKKDWSLKVTIERPARETADIRRMRAAARKRQFRANILPSGVSMDQMAERWGKEGKINPASSAPAPTFDPAHWEKANWKTQRVREISRKGAAETKRLDEIDKEMGHERLVPDWVQASGMSSLGDKPDSEVSEVVETSLAAAEREAGERTAAHDDADPQEDPTNLAPEEEQSGEALPDPPTLTAFVNSSSQARPFYGSLESKKASTQPGNDALEKSRAPTLEEGGGKVPAEGMEKVTERMHEIPHTSEGEAHTHEWDESDNLHRVDTEMDNGTRPSSAHESSMTEWETEEGKPLPGTKAAKDDEAA